MALGTKIAAMERREALPRPLFSGASGQHAADELPRRALRRSVSPHCFEGRKFRQTSGSMSREKAEVRSKEFAV
jgi:hypothetical protein